MTAAPVASPSAEPHPGLRRERPPARVISQGLGSPGAWLAPRIWPCPSSSRSIEADRSPSPAPSGGRCLLAHPPASLGALFDSQGRWPPRHGR